MVVTRIDRYPCQPRFKRAAKRVTRQRYVGFDENLLSDVLDYVSSAKEACNYIKNPLAMAAYEHLKSIPVPRDTLLYNLVVFSFEPGWLFCHPIYSYRCRCASYRCRCASYRGRGASDGVCGANYGGRGTGCIDRVVHCGSLEFGSRARCLIDGASRDQHRLA